MSVFLLISTLKDKLQKMMISFLWGSGTQPGKGINWLHWYKLTMKKEFGGMGFRNLHALNLAMLEK